MWLMERSLIILSQKSSLVIKLWHPCVPRHSSGHPIPKPHQQCNELLDFLTFSEAILLEL